MSTQRRKPYQYRVARDAEGRPLCRWCHQPVTPPRRTFCSDTCVQEYRIRSDPGYARHCVWNRDHGMCAECGTDTRQLRRELEQLHEVVVHHYGTLEGKAARQRMGAIGYPFRAGPSFDEHLWEADHIIPVSEDGGECGLENYRTLCRDCHRRETALLAKRRAARRRGVEQVEWLLAAFTRSGADGADD